MKTKNKKQRTAKSLKNLFNLLTIVFVFLLLFILQGCSGGIFQSKTGVKQVDVHQGTTGLTMDFGTNAPPSKTYMEQYFPITLTLKNKGAYDIDTGYLTLVYEKDYVRFDSSSWNTEKDKIQVKDNNKASIRLKGRNKYDNMGDSTSLTINAQTLHLDNQSELHNVNIIAFACYDYYDDLSTDVCIDFDPYNTKITNKPCTSASKSYSGQGGPIAIDSLTPNMFIDEDGGIKPSFEISITNKGDGLPYERGLSDDVCSSTTISHKMLNVVGVEATLAGKKMTCSPNYLKNGLVSLKDDTTKVRCVLDDTLYRSEDDPFAYTTTLQIHLDYGYRITKTTIVEIDRFDS